MNRLNRSAALRLWKEENLNFLTALIFAPLFIPACQKQKLMFGWEGRKSGIKIIHLGPRLSVVLVRFFGEAKK